MLTYRRFEKESDYDIMGGILQNNCTKTGHLYPQLHVGNLDFERFSFDESPEMIYENIQFVCRDGKVIGFLDVREDEFFITLATGEEEWKAEIMDYIEETCYPKGATLSTDANSEDVVFTELLAEKGFAKTEGSRFHGICDLSEIEAAKPMLEGYRIRTSTLADLSRRAELYVLATGGVKTTEAQYERMMQGPAYGDALDMVVETEAGEIIAYCTFWNDPVSKIGILEPLACVSEHRRKGITKALLLYGMNELKNKGTRYMYVGTGGKNAASQALYKSVGFKPYGMDCEWQKQR